MNFQLRNTTWTGPKRTFLQLNSRSSSPRLWAIEVVGNVIHTWWGQQGGAIQHASEVSNGVNHGKSNEVSPERHALELAQEKCRKHEHSGYREIGENGQPLDEATSTSIDFDNLPPSLCFYKPDNTMGAKITKLADAGKVLYSRKRNGLAFVISKGTGAPKLYSRRMLRQHDDEAGSPWTWDDRFPHIVAAADKAMPPNSILLGELVMDRYGQDDFTHVQSITKSLTPESQQRQAVGGYPSFYIWDVAFWKGVDMVGTATVQDRYKMVHDICLDPLVPGGTRPYLLPVQVFTSSSIPNPQAAITIAKNNGWEGFVVVDPNGVYGDKAYNFKGKPDRPGTVCAKLKPEWEADFVVLWDPSKEQGEASTKGRYAAGGKPGIKCVSLWQYNTNGELVFVSNCASGMTEEMKTGMANPSIWPRVWEVAYSGRRYISDGDDTNALDFPRFIREREDKALTECVDGKL